MFDDLPLGPVLIYVDEGAVPCEKPDLHQVVLHGRDRPEMVETRIEEGIVSVLVSYTKGIFWAVYGSTSILFVWRLTSTVLRT